MSWETTLGDGAVDPFAFRRTPMAEGDVEFFACSAWHCEDIGTQSHKTDKALSGVVF
jgi:hypothetical protein